MSSNAKRLTAGAAALMILLFHCWIPVFSYGTLIGSAERFLIASMYTGVDIFFFLTAFSLVSRPVEDYGSFLKSRAVKILPLFFIALAAGKFLWFLPSLMIVYLLLPPLERLCRRNPRIAFPLLWLGWAALLYLVLGVLRPEQDIGIFLFRIPIIILGAYAVRYKESLSPHRARLIGILLLAAGILLIYRYGYLNKLSVPYRDAFYLTAIPAALGTVLLLDLRAERGISSFTKRFGSMTLELYFSQMMLGSWLVGLLFGLTGSRLLTNLLTLTVIFAAASLVKRIEDRVPA